MNHKRFIRFNNFLDRLLVEKSKNAYWTTDELAKLNQTLSLFEDPPVQKLEKTHCDRKEIYS